jgi:hypothetical protein
LYQPNENVQLEVHLEEETVWLTQAQMAELFQKDRTVVTRHINNVFTEGELDQESNVHFLHIPFSDRPVKLYSLDVIISVGYRVKSQRGTQFRQWANKVLKDYLLKGYAINQRLLKIENQLENQQTLLAEHSEKIDFFVRTSLPPVEGIFFEGVQVFADSHDRFLMIDETVYHIGASLKDLGKKWFAFNKMEINSTTLLSKM